MKKQITYDLIKSFKPCYKPEDIGIESGFSTSVLEVINQIEKYKKIVKHPQDIVWLLCRPEFLTLKQIVKFAKWNAERATRAEWAASEEWAARVAISAASAAWAAWAARAAREAREAREAWAAREAREASAVSAESAESAESAAREAWEESWARAESEESAKWTESERFQDEQIDYILKMVKENNIK